jgi:protein O-GlcNAc transferase
MIEILKVSRPDPLRCQNTGLFQGYRKFVLQAFNLLDVAPPAIPTVTLTLRHRYPGKNVGRVLKNEKEVVGVLKEGNMMNLNVVDTAKMSFYEQLKLVRSTNILIGVHGAGLMFIMFAAEEAILIEIHPSYRQDRHFRFAARMTGKIYMPLRSLQRETCIGTSDDVVVPVGEFRILMDGAVRLARSELRLFYFSCAYLMYLFTLILASIIALILTTIKSTDLLMTVYLNVASLVHIPY